MGEAVPGDRCGCSTFGHWFHAWRRFRKIELDPGGQLAETEIEEIYQNRELLLSWDLISDQELELSFRQLEDEEAGWLDDLVTPTDSGDASTTIKSPAELKGPAGEK